MAPSENTKQDIDLNRERIYSERYNLNSDDDDDDGGGDDDDDDDYEQQSLDKRRLHESIIHPYTL